VTVDGAVTHLGPWLTPHHVDTDGIQGALRFLTVSQRTVSDYRPVSVAALW